MHSRQILIWCSFSAVVGLPVIVGAQVKQTTQPPGDFRFGQIIECNGWIKTFSAATAWQSSGAPYYLYGIGVGVDPGLFEGQPFKRLDRHRYSTPYGLLLTEENGSLSEIKISMPGVFTQRYIVIGESTLSDVVQRHGVPVGGFQTSGDEIVVNYPYDGIAFGFAGHDKRVPKVLNDSDRVTSVILKRRVPDPRGADHSCGKTK
jgi:hypothetical protein